MKSSLLARVRGSVATSIADLRTYRWLSREARRLVNECASLDDLGAIVDRALGSDAFRPEQERGEIVRLLEMLRANPPQRVCEIGGRRGGTLFLFAQVAAPKARLLSLDLQYTAPRIWIAPRLTSGREVKCLRYDSHTPRALQAVRDWLRGDALDFLFIDGDHSFEGALQDLRMYGPLVRPGGLVALHDIVMDSKTRFGRPTAADTGQVPLVWRRIKELGLVVTEIVGDPDQDGFGIGVIHSPPLMPDGLNAQPSREDTQTEEGGSAR